MKYIKINLKPLSVNDAWQGKRFKTTEYKAFERDSLLMMPNLHIPENKLKISIEYGFSNKMSDVDNPTKCILDILQKRYGFNDNMIYELNLKKNIVEKGKEYFSFLIETL
jgi:Holliday junction resolvase RusA-like endonuclease